MKSIIFAALIVTTPALAYTDSKGYREPSEGCDIWTTTCAADQDRTVGVTAYGTRREFKLKDGDPGSGVGKVAADCRAEWPGDYRMQEYCINRQMESKGRLERKGLDAE
jgi:hypothetical protein